MPQRIHVENEDSTPDGVIFVGVDSVWENRYQIGTWSNKLGRAIENEEEAIRMYFEIIWTEKTHMRRYMIECLTGKDLACTCPVGAPCHGDKIIEILNPAT